MSIEIKELKIKFTVESDNKVSNKIHVNTAELEARIIEKSIDRLNRILEKKMER